MAGKDWNVKQCLDWTSEYLDRRGIERPRLSAEWLLTAATGLSRVGLYTGFDRPLNEDELSFMHQAVVRRAKGEPLQYITGETSFRTIDVSCEPGVLIPRPETEMLVEEVLSFLDQEVLGAESRAPKARVELPWNAEVEAARKAEEAAALVRETSEEEGLQDAAPADEVFGHAGVDEDANAPEGVGEDRNAEPVEDAAIGEAVIAATDETAASGLSSCEDATLTDLTDEAHVLADEQPSSFVGEASEEESGCVSRVTIAPAALAHARVLEVGCGTGCISLSIATERPGQVTCIATDIEPRAVALATKNREALGIDSEIVDFRLGNLVSPLNRETEWGTFDVLVSNPPYIPTSVMEELPHEVVDFEPALALEGGADGLDIFRRLLKAAPFMLRPGGLFACELFEGALEAAADLCREADMTDVRIVNDLTNRPRIVLARTPQTSAAD